MVMNFEETGKIWNEKGKYFLEIYVTVDGYFFAL